MSKKVADCFANGLLFDAADVFEPAFFEDVGESDDWSQLFVVSDAFNDAAQSVMLDGDVQRSVVLIGHVEKLNRERERLVIFQPGDFPNGRFVEEVYNGRILSVDSGSGRVFARQKIGDELKGFAFVAAETFAVVLHGDIDAKAH